jgi:GH15 family glucan-1,4-alpha-glucosidase
MRLPKVLAALPFLALLASPARAAVPHPSWNKATVGNGFGFSVYDADARKLSTFTELSYANRSAGKPTRNLAYDAYFGLRASGGSAWLNELPVDSGGLRYADQSGVVEVSQQMGPLHTRQYVFSPWGLEASAVVLALEITNTSSIAQPDAAAYALLNFHLGAGAPSPGTAGEQLTYDGSNDSYSETGPSGLTARYLSLVPSKHHGASPKNPWPIVKGGGDLVDVEDSGVLDDAVGGFQWSLEGLAPGETRWVGVLVTLGASASAQAYLAKRTPDKLVKDELAQWEAWRKPPPAGLSEVEKQVFRQSEVVLRMAQSREAAPSKGQILASLPPGIWWIAWVRDMSYAIAALARSGHKDEASLGVDFFANAKVGSYKDQVGRDYFVSVVRYFGDGTEESDTNADGPNVEFDGFGLSTWAAHQAGRTELDKNADVLRSLVDSKGLIKADSSIWEVHWNGKQKQYAYTSIAGARGLCDAGDAKSALALRDAIVKNLRIPGAGLAQSFEELQSGKGYYDAAVIEAIDFGLLNPRGEIAQRILVDLEKLRVPSAHGYFRNDDGGGYDSQEWVFIDLRIASALARMGRVDAANELLGWVTGQAALNQGLVPELMHRENGDYVGAVPMVGFGAGAYMLALMDRAQYATAPAADPCFPAEGPDVAPIIPPTPDAGVDSSIIDAGGPPASANGDDQVRCNCGHTRDARGAFPFALALLALVTRRRAR